ncbi:MAG: hypothetical protein C0614_05250 [Desulfuromonas sp.]|nr:MAG: hypothetical protein C0614_05250 [Desulfuromonas sp.]
MLKIISYLQKGECCRCHRTTLVRDRFDDLAHKVTQLCIRCVPVDGQDMVHQSSKLVAAGY